MLNTNHPVRELTDAPVAHVVDLETMGKKAGCPVIAIGAVRVDLYADEFAISGEPFYAHIRLDSNEQYGLRPDSSTILWWMKQSDAARRAIWNEEGASTLADALDAYIQWHGSRGKDEIWCNGSNFDHPIIGEAFDRCGFERPWPFWNERCFRTERAQAKKRGYVSPAFSGVAHNALDDAINHAFELFQITKFNNK